ncbi:glycoside hydrolase family 5 protein [Moniliophthora roreri MCA 2997]|uniref:Glycoside hydrolase family 5 protein n=1 Tax=Moniliophthora roreri (strain MCA 2997) TaxID=1381753 RepID=V2XR44_MONRO|nr:glycoside hydrolase family 5 protein [Moniliophthora roreri MCA 2997]
MFSQVFVAIISYLSTVATAATVSSSPAQTILGIGGSGAWWPHDLYRFPEATRQNLSNLLFSQEGLGLSSYRWNVGAGGVGVSNPVRAPETFYIGAGTYNWSADPQGVYFLREASKRGVQDLTMFANSAPAPLTSGKTSCGSNFVSGSGNAYGTFLADVVEHFRNEGININFISPMNEPDSDFGPVPCGQEGMKVASTQRAEVVNSLWNSLNQKGLANSVGILADESSSLSLATNEYKDWLLQVVDKEICCSLGNADGSGRGWSGGYDPTIKNALMFSGLVFQSLVVAGESHYDFWTLVSNGIGCSPLNNPSCIANPNSNGWTDGVIYYDDEYATNRNYQLYITKHFWTYKHFGNFVKPGSQRRAITGSGANNNMLAVSTSSKYYVLAMNPTNSASTLSLTFPENVCAVASYRTSTSEDFARLNGATRSGSSWSLPLNAMSLTTFEFNRGAC